MEETESHIPQTELQKEIDSLHCRIERLKVALENTLETTEREHLETEIQSKEEILNGLQSELKEGVRRSTRQKTPTPKMLELQMEEARKRERKLILSYEKWKAQARRSREQLKSDIGESELVDLMDSLEKEKDDVLNAYLELRKSITPAPELRRHVDSCEAVTADIMKVSYERMAGIDGDYDPQQVQQRLKELLKSRYARSIYGSTVSRVSRSIQSQEGTTLTVKQVDAAAELAAKEAEFEVLMEEEKQREKIEEQQRQIEVERRRLERIQVEKDLKAARARLHVYNQGVSQEGSVHSHWSSERNHHSLHVTGNQNPVVTVSSPDVNALSLAQALQESMALNRLPVPEPSVFNGDPIRFIEWKTSFMSLIDSKAISAADKLFYLRKYVGGPARKTLEGTFFRNDNEAYRDAWNKLNDRYGQPFIIQRAFRDKLSDWPKILPRDAIALREFSDFLNACQDAMSHVKSLEILNDCEENKKLIQKLPNYQNGQHLNGTGRPQNT
ncbi:GRB10-interacting GYF protein 2-like [Oryzias melastigma]|uniref:GRB10-interacting GYF protein 2-like n=1 Tax=Oryzias melastigma TaxID=30732 RepID=UPI00168D7438|nr:GRB10-interacting GYF protein 2-like [Oryzias melastigma]